MGEARELSKCSTENRNGLQLDVLRTQNENPSSQRTQSHVIEPVPSDMSSRDNKNYHLTKFAHPSRHVRKDLRDYEGEI